MTSGGEQADVLGSEHGRESVGDAELGRGVSEVLLDGPLRDGEPSTDRGSREYVGTAEDGGLGTHTTP